VIRLPAVLLDLGDVLVHLEFTRGLRHFQRIAGCTDAQAAGLYLSKRALETNRGHLQPDEFLRELAGQMGAPDLEIEALRQAWCDIFRPWPEMERLAEDLIAAGHPTWLVSNTDPLHFSHLRPRLPVLERFTGLFLSYEAGLIKPDPAYFHAALERVGLPAAQCVFVDDRPENVEAARTCGLRAILRDGDADEARRQLRDAGVAV
jgi:HAD superfamily hydrolase (TIGR01509 family)